LEIAEKDLSLMSQIIHTKYESLKAQGKKHDPVDAALLGAALVGIKQALPHGDFQRFVEERCPFDVRTARRFKERLWSYLVQKHLDEEMEAKVDAEAKLTIRWPGAAQGKG
jgi:hypothetical protein